MEILRVKYDVILRDEEAVNAIDQLKIINKKVSVLNEEAKAQILAINKVLESKTSKFFKSTDTITSQLEVYFKKIEEPHETKTMKSYELENGKLIMNKATTKLTHNDVVIFEWAKDYKQYVKSVPELDWTSLKANLIISDKSIVFKDTHKAVDIAGLKVSPVPERFEVKY